MANEVTLTKGEYSVTIYCIQIEDGFINKITTITPPTGKQNQDAGPKANKIVDLLRVTRTFRLQGHILNNTDKASLINIIQGGGVKGGVITFTYDDGGDATSFDVFVENCIFTQKSADEPTSPPTDFAKHDVNITLIKGTTIGG